MSEGRHALGEEPAVIAVTELLVEPPVGSLARWRPFLSLGTIASTLGSGW